jgi:hypothetical protein
MGPVRSILETYLGQSTNLKLNLKLKVACKRMGTRAAPPPTRASVAEALPGYPPGRHPEQK